MEQVLDFLAENAVYIVLTAGVIIANLFGKPKTAEQLEKARQKQKEKLAKKGEKETQKLQVITEKLQEIEKEEILKKGGD